MLYVEGFARLLVDAGSLNLLSALPLEAAAQAAQYRGLFPKKLRGKKCRKKE